MLNVLSAGDLELKLLAAKKILTVICMRVNSVQMFAKQVSLHKLRMNKIIEH